MVVPSQLEAIQVLKFRKSSENFSWVINLSFLCDLDRVTQSVSHESKSNLCCLKCVHSNWSSVTGRFRSSECWFISDLGWLCFHADMAEHSWRWCDKKFWSLNLNHVTIKQSIRVEETDCIKDREWVIHKNMNQSKSTVIRSSRIKDCPYTYGLFEKNNIENIVCVFLKVWYSDCQILPVDDRILSVWMLDIDT